MQRRPLLVGALLVAVVGAALILLWIQRGTDAVPGPPTATEPTSIVSSGPRASQSPTPTPEPPATAEPPAASHPAADSTLRIPAIDLVADLHPEGLRGGKVNPPAGTVMWYTGHDRVAPGSAGTSVIAGHVVARGQPDRFANLAKVAVGDTVEVTAEDGTTSTYTVVRAEVVDKDALTTDADVWGANSSVRRLAIVTCDDAHGFRGDGHRVANFVVIAEPA